MFDKLSRYRKVPNVAALDALGRTLSTKDLRLLPTVTGVFRHTVDAGDRLDQLGYKYYGEPLQWWRICDANPQFLSPFALLGQDTIVTTEFPVSVAPGSDPPWAALFRGLAALLGVADVAAQEDVEILPQRQVVGGQTVTVFVERFSRSVRVTYNKLNVAPDTLAASIETAGFTVGLPVAVGRLGQEIVIPPKPIG